MNTDWWPLEGWRREVAIWTAVVVATILLGDVIGTALAGRPARSHAVQVSRLDALVPGDVELATGARPEKLDKPVGVGFEKAGLSLTAASEVDSVRLEQGSRRAPEGSNLIAFTVGDWTCETDPCDDWESLEPAIDLNGESQALPEGGSTFVVVVPPGTSSVDLTMAANGYTQSISLLDHTDGPDTIKLLARSSFDKKLVINQTFGVSEVTSIALDDGLGGTNTVFTRQVTVAYAQARFFLNGKTPTVPAAQFLVINAYYSFPGRTGSYIFTPGEIAFVDKSGHRYPAQDLDPSPDNGLLGFEVPSSVRSGKLVVGGRTTEKTASNGATYTSTITEKRLPINLDPKK